ncbi:MAG: VanZ family protein [Thermodesulfobacteriota bacterium]
MPPRETLSRFALQTLPALLYMAWIFYLSSLPNPLPVPLPPGVDKIAHFGQYGLLGILLARAVHSRGSGGFFLRWLMAAALAAAYGVSDEFHQYFVPGRNADVLDALADALGGAAGAWAWLAAVRARPGLGKL